MAPRKSRFWKSLRLHEGQIVSARDANSLTGRPVPECPYCNGEGKIQYGIDEVELE